MAPIVSSRWKEKIYIHYIGKEIWERPENLEFCTFYHTWVPFINLRKLSSFFWEWENKSRKTEKILSHNEADGV